MLTVFSVHAAARCLALPVSLLQIEVLLPGCTGFVWHAVAFLHSAATRPAKFDKCPDQLFDQTHALMMHCELHGGPCLSNFRKAPAHAIVTCRG